MATADTAEITKAKNTKNTRLKFSGLDDGPERSEGTSHMFCVFGESFDGESKVPRNL